MGAKRIVGVPNHYHLLIETPRDNIKQIMQNIITSYTVFINRKYHRSGHLFQGRYVVRRPEHFRWSSYRDYIRSRNIPYAFWPRS